MADTQAFSDLNARRRAVDGLREAIGNGNLSPEAIEILVENGIATHENGKVRVTFTQAATHLTSHIGTQELGYLDKTMSGFDQLIAANFSAAAGALDSVDPQLAQELQRFDGFIRQAPSIETAIGERDAHLARAEKTNARQGAASAVQDMADKYAENPDVQEQLSRAAHGLKDIADPTNIDTRTTISPGQTQAALEQAIAGIGEKDQAALLSQLEAFDGVDGINVGKVEGARFRISIDVFEAPSSVHPDATRRISLGSSEEVLDMMANRVGSMIGGKSADEQLAIMNALGEAFEGRGNHITALDLNAAQQVFAEKMGAEGAYFFKEAVDEHLFDIQDNLIGKGGNATVLGEAMEDMRAQGLGNGNVNDLARLYAAAEANGPGSAQGFLNELQGATSEVNASNAAVSFKDRVTALEGELGIERTGQNANTNDAPQQDTPGSRGARVISRAAKPLGALAGVAAPILSAGVASAAGADAEEVAIAALEASPLSAGVAAAEGRPMEAWYRSAEEYPVIGTIYTEMARPLQNLIGNEKVDPGLIEDVAINAYKTIFGNGEESVAQGPGEVELPGGERLSPEAAAAAAALGGALKSQSGLTGEGADGQGEALGIPVAQNNAAAQRGAVAGV